MFHEVLPHLRKRPLMFGVDGTFATHVSFLYGYSAGDSQGELQEFHAWLTKDSETSSNMSWAWLVLKKAFPGQSALWDPGAPALPKKRIPPSSPYLNPLRNSSTQAGKGSAAHCERYESI